MKKTTQRQKYLSKHAENLLRNKVKRKKRKHKSRAGRAKFLKAVSLLNKQTGKDYSPHFYHAGNLKTKSKRKSKYSKTLNYIASKNGNVFSIAKIKRFEDGNFEIPKIFSLIENPEESFYFLKRLFNALHNQSVRQISFNYGNCQKIDVDASVCMDILLNDFIRYFEDCRNKGIRPNIVAININNYSAPHIQKVLFSIGAFKNVKNISIPFTDIIPYPLCVGNYKDLRTPAKREIDITRLVDYVIQCMEKMGKTLTGPAETNLFNVISEVLINAEEHATTNYRYSVGYFQDIRENDEHIGILNLAILNFGYTIYEKFKDPNCPNKQVVEQMKELSKGYIKKSLFKSSEFEEETLWTLYALQEGVTSKADWKRGNGSIRFIESFFSLKGDQSKDNKSFLSIVSGNTRITFDGTFRIIEVTKAGGKVYKMMAFNDSGDIETIPDKDYVRFTENYFPGTIITAKICIKDINTESIIK